MNETLDQNLVTTTAATQQTEPEVVAAIASGDGQIANEKAIRGVPMQSRRLTSRKPPGGDFADKGYVFGQQNLFGGHRYPVVDWSGEVLQRSGGAARERFLSALKIAEHSTAE